MKAVIFDMDGVIIDSEPIHNRLMLITLRHFGIPFDEKDFVHYVGTTNAYLFKDVIEKHHAAVSVEEMDTYQFELLIRTISEEKIEPIPGIRDLLKQLKERKIPAAIASSSSLELINLITRKFEIHDDFAHFLSGEDLPHSKPNPEIYLRTAEILGVPPTECLVIEDARHGVKAAKAAKMTCVGFKNPGSGEQDLSEADFTVDTIADIDLGRFSWT